MSDLRALQQQLADTPLAPFDVHQHVGQFLAREAWLLDRRLFERWVDLFTDDGIYWVPSGREDGDPGIDAVIVYESKRELRAHVSRLRHPLAITEQPPPRVRHVLGPVLAWQTSEGLVASVNMLVEVHWAANRRQFTGSCDYLLVAGAGAWRIREKRVYLLANDQPVDMLPIL